MREDQQELRRLQELKDFLLTRRKRLAPEQIGLSPGEKRRTPGLRRAEVAQLAGISVDWYTWLEQGRPITVSIQVLESLAQALRLDANEREYLFFLALQQPPPERVLLRQTVSAMVQHFLNHLDASPAYVTGERWDIVAWNEAACAVFGDFGQMTTQERNAVWRMFLSPTHHQMLVDWEENARHVLAQFRASCGRFPGDPQMTELLNALMRNSPEFRAWWPDHEVLRLPEGTKVFNHPQGGCLVFEHLTFQVYDAPEFNVTVYTPVDGTETRARLGQLLVNVEIR
jgi:transcriptional regulator with XRE-family HTH domain